MKLNIFFSSLLALFIVYMFSSCSGSGKNGTTNDTLDSAAIKADSLKNAATKMPDTLVIKGTNVNLRVKPGLKAIKIKQLTTNDTCEILERSELDTIDEFIDYWYKVRFKKKEGWVFGEFTSLKLDQEAQKKKSIFFKEKK